MTSSRYPHITDELLSAYIDDTVTEDEKALIEATIINEPAIAWRLETLRYTVNLLNSLPTVALPRSFALSEIQMFHGAAQPALVPQTNSHSTRPRLAPRPRIGIGDFAQSWRNFWQIGNIFLRNATAASLAIFLILSAGNFFVTGSSSSGRERARPAQSAVTTLTYSNVVTDAKNALAETSTPSQSQSMTPPLVNAQLKSSTPPADNANPVNGASAGNTPAAAVANTEAQTRLAASVRDPFCAQAFFPPAIAWAMYR